MRNIIFFILAVFLLIGCSSKEPQKAEIKEPKKEQKVTRNHYYIEEFIYKKEQIDFFEKEYSNILNVNDKKILEDFIDFYKKNSTYFKNSKIKIRTLEKKLKTLSTKTNQESHRVLLTKALSLSKEEALKIYEKLAHDENIFAQRELAEIYKHEDKLKSIFWYKKLVQNNDIKSIKDLAFANLHKISPVVVQDTNRAVELYKKLESLGEISALVHLGNIYEYGYFKDDIPIDRKKSLEYFEKAASQDYTPAQKKLVKIYLCEKCKGDRYNKEKGLKTLNILIEKGDEESKKILENISSKEPIEKEEVQEEPKPTEEIKESEGL